MSPLIIFEDELLLVINKSSGLVVNRSDSTGKIETVQDWAEDKVQEEIELIREKKETANDLEKEFLSRCGVVHRLDKDTSGVLVIAKTAEAFENLKDQFKSRDVVKKYLALVHGKVEPEGGSINAPIARSPFNPMHFGVFPGGREAVTDYRVVKNYQLGNMAYTLVELTPHTGRTHQIRVHLKYLNYPIVSDPIYGGRKNYQADLKFCPRLFLHAAFLKIKHPKSNEDREFNCPLPVDLEAVLGLLK